MHWELSTAQTATSQSFIENTWYRCALLMLLIAAIFGTAMRFMYLVEVDWLDYRNVLHAHSHVALLGWGFTAVAGALLFFLIGRRAKRRVYGRILALNVIAGTGMAVFFTIQGYGNLSIAFSTLHVVVAYFFCWHFLRDLNDSSRKASTRFAKWAVWWLLASTIGLLGVGIISASFGKLHPLFHASVQFFLHFQFNGWFTYAILALLVHHFARNGKEAPISNSHFYLLHISLVLTYALSITWSTPEAILFYLNSAGVLIQLLAIGLILRSIFMNSKRKLKLNTTAEWLIAVGLISLVLKVIIQTAVAVPAVAEISYTIRNFVVGFIHLTMFGSITLLLMGILLKRKRLPNTRLAVSGYGLTIAGFIATELLLFFQGLWLWLEMGFFPAYHTVLFGFTALLPAGILIINISKIKGTPQKHFDSDNSELQNTINVNKNLHT